ACSAVISSFADALTPPATRVSVVTDVGRACPPAGSPAAIGDFHRRSSAHPDLQTAATAQLAHPTRVGVHGRPPAPPRRLTAASAGVLCQISKPQKVALLNSHTETP